MILGRHVKPLSSTKPSRCLPTPEGIDTHLAGKQSACDDESCGDLQFQVRLDRLVRSSAAHPKTAALLRILKEHFQQSRSAGSEAWDVSRVIVFTNLRETVTVICEALRPHEPLLQARSALLPV